MSKTEIKNCYNIRYLWDYLIRYHKGDYKKAMNDYRKMMKGKNNE